MKRKFLICIMCFLLTGIHVCAEEQTYIVKFKPEIQFENLNKNFTSDIYYSVTIEELEKYLDMGVVEFYEPDHVIELIEDFSYTKSEPQPSIFSLSTNDPWHLRSINISKVWDMGCYGTDVRIGVIDSGIHTHSDLVNNILPGHNYMNNTASTSDTVGHGTYVSGFIAAECNNEYITGVAHRAKLVPLKCFDSGAATKLYMIANAIRGAVDDYNCDVINLSLGTTDNSDAVKQSVEYAIQKGCIVVAAVGNKGSSIENYPAKYNGVIGVGSVDESGGLSWFSQRNSTVDVVAPGNGVVSTMIDGYDKKENYDKGTSYSAPQVSALAAIAKSINPDINAQEFLRLLEKTSSNEKIAEDDISYCGYGIIDCEKFVGEMIKNLPVFISPFTDNRVKIYNNSGEKISATGIISEYNGNKFLGIKSFPVELENNGISDYVKTTDNSISFTVWNSISGMLPMSNIQKNK